MKMVKKASHPQPNQLLGLYPINKAIETIHPENMIAN